jgi:hypothetical protein
MWYKQVFFVNLFIRVEAKWSRFFSRTDFIDHSDWIVELGFTFIGNLTFYFVYLRLFKSFLKSFLHSFDTSLNKRLDEYYWPKV